MKKMSKRLIALLLAAVMVMGLSITTFASTNTSHQVKIYLQKIERDEDGAMVSQRILNNNNYVSVTVSDGTSLKQAIINACTENPSVMSLPDWDEYTGEYLTTLKVGSETLTNQDYFPTDNSYEGFSWMYYNNDTDHVPSTTNDYPQISLARATVTSDMTITLSYEWLVYTW